MPDSTFQSLDSQIQLNDLLSLSQNDSSKVFYILKHSTRCSISSMALSRIERSTFFKDNKLQIFILDLLKHRDVSNTIAQLLNVEHESPQLLLIKNGKCTAYCSHNEISNQWLIDNKVASA